MLRTREHLSEVERCERPRGALGGRGPGGTTGITGSRRRAGLASGARVALMVVAALGLAAGCSDDDGSGDVVPEGCNPLAGSWDCLLPYPSDFFLVDDAAMPSGKRVVITPQAQMEAVDVGKVDFYAMHPADGFGIHPPILAFFPFDVDESTLIFHTDNVEESLGAESPTVLMEADTGIRVLHFAELDPRADDPKRRAFIIRPMVRLEHSTRYIVAIRGLVQTGGEPVPPAPGFARLRDGSAGSHAVLGQLEDHYENDIFPALEDAGVDRASLLLAWDFTTASEEWQTRDLLRVRDLVMASLEATPPPVTVEEVTDDYDNIFRRVRGTIQVPLYMETAKAGAIIHRGSDGQVEENGTAEFDFSMLIPKVVADASPVVPVRTLQFGHGFFGGIGEFEGGYVRDFLERTHMVGIGIEWWGMATGDLATVITDIMTNTGQTLRFTDRVHQGMANQIAVTYALKTTLADLDELKVDGTLVYDPEEIYYYGISQGGILGGTYMALTPHVSRATFSVGACSFPFMMMRSSNFVQFLGLIEMVLPDFLDQQKFVGLIPTVFERVDPITYAPYVMNDLLPGAPDERFVLMQIGIGDPQVPNVASHVHARALGVTNLLPGPRTIQALPASDGPLDSALVEFDFNLAGEIPGTYAIPPAGEMTEDNPVHEGVRRTGAAMDMIDGFFHPDGQIVNTCDGACDPE